MNDVKKRLRRELAHVEPSPDGLEKTLRLVRRRERNRRAGAAAVGLLLLPGLALGVWLSLRSQQRLPAPPPAATSGPVAGPGEPRLFLAGAGELWVVDVAGGSVRHRSLPQLSPGDPPYRIVRRGDKLVLWSYQTLTLEPSSAAAQPEVLVRDSWIFIPAAAPDRIWVGILDRKSPETERRLKAVREVAVDGRVTVGDRRPPEGRWPVAATSSGLVFPSHGSGPDGLDQLELWNPLTRKVFRRLPGDHPVASHGDLLAWCRQPCGRLHVTNVATGEDVEVRPPAGTFGFDADVGSDLRNGRSSNTGWAPPAPGACPSRSATSSAWLPPDGTARPAGPEVWAVGAWSWWAGESVAPVVLGPGCGRRPCRRAAPR